MKQLLAWCEAEQSWMDESIEALVRIESPTTDKAAVDRCGVELAARLSAIGGRVQSFPRETAGNHLLAEFGCGTRQVLLLAHFDTVWPVGTLEVMPLRRDGHGLTALCKRSLGSKQAVVAGKPLRIVFDPSATCTRFLRRGRR